jgi:hypothetical protein
LFTIIIPASFVIIIFFANRFLKRRESILNKVTDYIKARKFTHGIDGGLFDTAFIDKIDSGRVDIKEAKGAIVSLKGFYEKEAYQSEIDLASGFLRDISKFFPETWFK